MKPILGNSMSLTNSPINYAGQTKNWLHKQMLCRNYIPYQIGNRDDNRMAAYLLRLRFSSKPVVLNLK
jgi:hypothetical protein